MLIHKAKALLLGAGYVMHSQGLAYEDALALVKTSRPSNYLIFCSSVALFFLLLDLPNSIRLQGYLPTAASCASFTFFSSWAIH